MPSVHATVEVPVDSMRLYRYLQSRYDGEAYRAASMATRRYLPPVKCLEAIEGERLRFSVSAREALMHIRWSGWTWTYELEPVEQGRTRLTIRYEWSLLLSLLSGGSARLQAANELTQTVMAVEALAFDRS
jgi:hypothetical protein